MFRVTNQFLPALLAAVFLLFSSSIGQCHNLWLNATDYAPSFRAKTGAHTKVYFGFGHKFPVADLLEKDKLTEFNLIQPGGVVKELEAEEGGFLVTPLVLKKKGGHIVTAATKHGFYTMYEEKGKIRHKLASMEGLENIVLSLYYENYTKALISAGESSEDAFATPVGHNIEIVPLENPFLKRPGDFLKVKVLFDGKPAKYCNVFATYIGFSPKEAYAWSSKTNAKGINQVKLLQSGQWIVKAVVRIPPSEDHKGKVLEEKYTAIMSFQVN